jgi:transposase
MKTKLKEQKVNSKAELLACYDVSGDELHFCTEYSVKDKVYGIDDIISNKTRSINNHFFELEDVCRRLKKNCIHIFCEPTGGHEKKLILAAHKRNYKVSYVSSEATKKARVIESNDDSKYDSKDKHIVLTLAKMSKTLSCRKLPPAYSRLRLLGEYYDDTADNAMRIRTEIASVKQKLFPDFPFKCSYLYTKAGEVLIEKYGLNPYNITKYSWGYFWQRMKTYLRQPEKEKLKEIYRNAKSSAMYISEMEASISENQLAWLWNSYNTSIKRKNRLKDELCELYRTLPECRLLSNIKDISDSLMSRVVAETGPLSDFKNWSQLLRYAGLNLRIRQSGKYRGLNKISKKGRPLLRKVLYQLAFSCLIGDGKMYHDDYTRKKQASESGLCAMVLVMRKALKMILGVSKSSITFDIERVHKDQTEYRELDLTA